MKETSGVLVQFPSRKVVDNRNSPAVLINTQGEPQLLGSKFYRVFPGPHDVNQTILTIDEYTKAGNMDYKDIADALEGLGYRVDRFEANAPMAAGWQERGNNPIEDEHKYLRWQNRHETILLARLPSPNAGNQGTNIIPPEQKFDVIEGIGVVKPNQSQLPQDNVFDIERKNNQYINTPVDIQALRENKKAA